MKITETQLRRIIAESLIAEISRSDGSLGGMIDAIGQYKDHTWIFFDTETTGLRPRSLNRPRPERGPQLTQIAAIAAKPGEATDEPQILGTFNKKIKFTPYTKELMTDPTSLTRQAWDRRDAQNRQPLGDPRKLLSLTGYGERGIKYDTEEDVINAFFEFVASFDRPLLIAQNAAFDMRFINVRSGGRMPRYPVLDTLPLVQDYLFPTLKSAAAQGDVEASSLLASFKKGNRLSASMGVVAKGFGIEVEGWHNALADVKMMMSMYSHVMRTLEPRRDIDARPEIGKALRARHRSR